MCACSISKRWRRNARAHAIGGIACPLGAHYLPLPGEQATEVIELLEELGLRWNGIGGPVYDERSLCHSPQERLFIDGDWHEGLLPPVDALPAAERAATLAGYRRFAAAVGRLSAGGRFAIPTARAARDAEVDVLDTVTFAHWLDREGHAAPALRWYLDYCCRDDDGAGAAQVSAWAGLHYFASRHGFHARETGPRAREVCVPGQCVSRAAAGAPLADRAALDVAAVRESERCQRDSGIGRAAPDADRAVVWRLLYIAAAAEAVHRLADTVRRWPCPVWRALHLEPSARLPPGASRMGQ